jgi:hypothetical protein
VGQDFCCAGDTGGWAPSADQCPFAFACDGLLSAGTDEHGCPFITTSQSKPGITSTMCCGCALDSGTDAPIELPPDGGSGDAGIDLSKLHSSCPEAGVCPTGLTAITYYGFAGQSGPELCSCEIPCNGNLILCPTGTSCVYIADGPGNVCD